MAELAREEVELLQASIEERGEALKVLLLPRDPLDDKSVMLEVGGRRGRLFGRGRVVAVLRGSVSVQRLELWLCWTTRAGRWRCAHMELCWAVAAHWWTCGQHAALVSSWQRSVTG